MGFNIMYDFHCKWKPIFWCTEKKKVFLTDRQSYRRKIVSSYLNYFIFFFLNNHWSKNFFTLFVNDIKLLKFNNFKLILTMYNVSNIIFKWISFEVVWYLESLWSRAESVFGVIYYLLIYSTYLLKHNFRI